MEALKKSHYKNLQYLNIVLWFQEIWEKHTMESSPDLWTCGSPINRLGKMWSRDLWSIAWKTCPADELLIWNLLRSAVHMLKVQLNPLWFFTILWECSKCVCGLCWAPGMTLSRFGEGKGPGSRRWVTNGNHQWGWNPENVWFSSFHLSGEAWNLTLTVQSSFLGVTFNTWQRWIEQPSQTFVKDSACRSLHISANLIHMSEVTTTPR